MPTTDPSFTYKSSFQLRDTAPPLSFSILTFSWTNFPRKKHRISHSHPFLSLVKAVFNREILHLFTNFLCKSAHKTKTLRKETGFPTAVHSSYIKNQFSTWKYCAPLHISNSNFLLNICSTRRKEGLCTAVYSCCLLKFFQYEFTAPLLLFPFWICSSTVLPRKKTKNCIHSFLPLEYKNSFHLGNPASLHSFSLRIFSLIYCPINDKRISYSRSFLLLIRAVSKIETLHHFIYFHS